MTILEGEKEYIPEDDYIKCLGVPLGSKRSGAFNMSTRQ
jgi:hypothetical protein